MKLAPQWSEAEARVNLAQCSGGGAVLGECLRLGVRVACHRFFAPGGKPCHYTVNSGSGSKEVWVVPPGNRGGLRGNPPTDRAGDLGETVLGRQERSALFGVPKRQLRFAPSPHSKTLTRSATLAFLPVNAGAVLLEVLLALALFVAAAAVATSALNSALASLDRQKLGLHALNLASSTLAELQLGVRPLAPQSPRPFEAPFQDWSWELVLSPLEEAGAETSAPGLVRTEVVVRHSTRPVVQRLSQILKPRPVSTNATLTATAP